MILYQQGGETPTKEPSAMDKWNAKFVDERDSTRKQRIGRKMGNPIQMGLFLARAPATISQGVFNVPRVFGNAARAGYNALTGDKYAMERAKQDAGNAAEETFFGKTPGENTIVNVAEAYTTDIPGQIFNILDYGKEKWGDFYNKYISKPGGSIPAAPTPDRQK